MEDSKDPYVQASFNAYLPIGTSGCSRAPGSVYLTMWSPFLTIFRPLGDNILLMIGQRLQRL